MNTERMFAVFDLDGTLCDITHRLPFIKREKPDWDGFFAACDKDTAKWDVIGLLMAAYGGRDEVVIVSGRSDVVMGKTKAWLKKHGINYDHLIMREEGNHEPDFKFKERILTKTLGVKNVRYVVDDRQQVVDMWRRNGVTCLQCAPGDF